MQDLQKILEECGVDLNDRSCKKPWTYSEKMLIEVSRTFALNIQVLPASLKRAVLLAYLFCRMADTVEDDPEMTGPEKEAHLLRFRKIFCSDDWKSPAEEFWKELPVTWADSSSLDQVLTYFPEWPLEQFFDLEDKVVEIASRWIDEMCKGMIKYSLQRENQKGWIRLETVSDLDDYCYYVAGTVGYMLTDLFTNHTQLISGSTYPKMKELCNSFGLALQYTNIIKDIHEDFFRETCYVPKEFIDKAGLDYDTFLVPENVEQGYQVVRSMSENALGHLENALEYILLLPRLEPRLRLFCLWPLFLATGTLVRVLESRTVLSEEKVKLTRAEVKSVIKGTSWRCLSNQSLRKLFEKDKKRIEKFIGEKA